jgi:hypothetical protein
MDNAIVRCGTSRRSPARLGSFALATLAGALALAFLTGCSSGDSDGPPAAKKATVYASGYYVNGDGNEIPCYWRNGGRVDLSLLAETNSGRANAITASGATIYIAGGSGTAHPIACYWTGGVRSDQEHFSMGAVGISVDGATVYTIVNSPYLTGPANGSTNSGMYYVNQTRAENLFGEGTYVKAISAKSGNICAVGQNDESRASYWLDTSEYGIIETQLDSGSSDACATYLSNNLNYIAGSIGGTFSEKPCYWIQTMGLPRFDLDIGSYNGEAQAIKVVDDVVYTAGWYNDGGGSGDIPCIWSGTGRIDLPKGALDAWATGIDVLDGVIYVSGWYNAYNEELQAPCPIPCYWTVIDGVPARTELPGGDTRGQATGIVVVME